MKKLLILSALISVLILTLASCGDKNNSPPHKHTYENNVCTGCGREMPGLYDAENNLLASWETLVNDYGMDVSKDYEFTSSHSESPYFVLNDLEKLSFGVKLIISDDVTRVGEYAFSDCTQLTSIIIPDSVTSIGDFAFNCCFSLTNINIPDSVTSIGVQVFSDCASLASITIPNSVTSIGNFAFYGCDSLASITIPNSVTSIGICAFSSCDSLASITISDSVTSIGDWVFSLCESLSTINFGGTMEQWYDVTKGAGWNVETGNYTVNCTNGTLTK